MMLGPILFQNATHSVTLIDIPRSIEHSQGTARRLRTSVARQLPYPSTEPKGRKRETLSASLSQHEVTYHHEMRKLILAALAEVGASQNDDAWCLPRETSEHHSPKDSANYFAVAQVGTGIDENKYGRSLELSRTAQAAPPVVLSPARNDFRTYLNLCEAVVCNPVASSVVLSTNTDQYHIPAHSTFFCSTVADSLLVLSRATRALLPARGRLEGGKFDFILLDPPWSNRSVRNGRFYRTIEDQAEDPFDQVLPLIKAQLSSRGLVAVWLTNKPAIRSRVSMALARFGLTIHQEWIWIKVTTAGEPITSLDGLWRKPYEVLLLFQRRSTAAAVERRVLIAVPDIHSRKPCLATLIEPLLPHPYRALEIFARNLTSGWWSIGDEVLKFQHEDYWKPRESLSLPSALQ